MVKPPRKVRRPRAKSAAAKARLKKLRELRVRAQIGAVYRDGKRAKPGPTIFELLAAYRAKAAKKNKTV